MQKIFLVKNRKTGGLLVREAGGIVSDFSEKNGWLKSGNIVASTPKIYQPLIKIIQQHITADLKN